MIQPADGGFILRGMTEEGAQRAVDGHGIPNASLHHLLSFWLIFILHHVDLILVPDHHVACHIAVDGDVDFPVNYKRGRADLAASPDPVH